METAKKLKAPTGSAHDIKYLYTVIAAINRKNGVVKYDAKTLSYFKKAVNEYNYAKSAAYGLYFKPREVNTYIVKDIVLELIKLKLVYKDGDSLRLTAEGENVACLIEEKRSDRLKQVFTRLVLDNYTVVEYFLKRLREMNKRELPIPFVTSTALDKSNGESRVLAENYLRILNDACPGLSLDPDSLYREIENTHLNSLNKTDKIKKLDAILEKFVVREVFKPHIRSRRVYDNIRSKTTFLGLTNYAIFDFDGFPAEVIYLTSDFDPSFKHNTVSIEYSRGRIYVNVPLLDDVREELKAPLVKAYIDKMDDLGYAKIWDVRDAVCRELRISDGLFDEYVKQLSKEEPNLFSFTYRGAGDKITEKRLPLIFEKPIREFFTYIKLNLTRGTCKWPMKYTDL